MQCTLHYANGGLRRVAELFISQCIMLISTCIYFPNLCHLSARRLPDNIAASADEVPSRVKSPESSTQAMRLIPLNPSAHPQTWIIKTLAEWLEKRDVNIL